MMSTLLQKATHIYDYIKTKKYVETYMQVNPQQTLVELHVEGMGFNMQNRAKKNCAINLQGIQDSEVSMLGLAFYSMRLSSIFQHEGFIANQIYNSIREEKPLPLNLSKLYVQAEKFAELMKNEHLYDIEFSEKVFNKRI